MNLRSKMKKRAKKLLLPRIFIPALYSEEDVENIKYGIDFC